MSRMTARISQADIKAAHDQSQALVRAYDKLKESGENYPRNAADAYNFSIMMLGNTLFKWKKGSNVTFFHGVITPFSVDSLQAMLDDLAEEDEIIINFSSIGGVVSSGIAISNMLAAARAKISINVLAVAHSAAGLVLCGAAMRRLAPGSFVGVHRSWTYAEGNYKEFEAVIKDLKSTDKRLMEIYHERVPESKWAQLEKDVDETTMYDRDAAIEMGLADEKMSMDEAKRIRAEYEDSEKAEIDEAPEAEQAPAEDKKEAAAAVDDSDYCRPEDLHFALHDMNARDGV